MAGIRFTLQTGVNATTTSKVTQLQVLAPANQRVLIKEISISFEGTTNTGEPVLVEMARQSTAGTGGSAVTPRKLDTGYAETIQASALENIVTAQPTETFVQRSEKIHPQGGFNWYSRFGDEIVVAGGDRFGIAITAGASVDCVVTMVCEE